VVTKRTEKSWSSTPEYLIGEKERTNVRFEQSENPRESGKEFCTVDGVEYWRYDCYVDFSPYGWQMVEEETNQT
jgi:hypothetical protein